MNETAKVNEMIPLNNFKRENASIGEQVSQAIGNMFKNMSVRR